MKVRLQYFVSFLTYLFSGKLASQGYVEHFYNLPQKERNEAKVNPGEEYATLLQKNHVIGPYSPFDKMKGILMTFEQPDHLADLIPFDEALLEAARLHPPDFFFVDGVIMPSIYYSEVSWINSTSPNPLFYYEGDGGERLPPGGSGDSDPAGWPAKWAILRACSLRSKNFNNLFESMGYARYTKDTFPTNSVLTVYACPNEINYPPIHNLPWFNLEVFTPNEKLSQVTPFSELGLPASFLSSNLNGKFGGHLVYMSLGSMGSVDLDLMKHLLSALSTSPHKYIISTGPHHDQLTTFLSENMYASPFLPQTDLIPHVNLVITHGGK